MNTSPDFQKLLSTCKWEQLSPVHNIISSPSNNSLNIISAAIKDDLILLYFPSNVKQRIETSENIIVLKNLPPHNRYITYAYNSVFDFFQELGFFSVTDNGELELSSLPFVRDILFILKKI